MIKFPKAKEIHDMVGFIEMYDAFKAYISLKAFSDRYGKDDKLGTILSDIELETKRMKSVRTITEFQEMHNIPFVDVEYALRYYLISATNARKWYEAKTRGSRNKECV